MTVLVSSIILIGMLCLVLYDLKLIMHLFYRPSVKGGSFKTQKKLNTAVMMIVVSNLLPSAQP